MYRAVLDTCVLVPGRQRDFLLQLATEEAYASPWGPPILFELDYVLARLDGKRGRDGSEERRHLFEQMERALPGAEINAPKGREYDYGRERRCRSFRGGRPGTGRVRYGMDEVAEILSPRLGEAE